MDIREICGRVLTPEAALAVWVAATPWASYALRYPAEKSIVTFDRVVVLLISAAFVGRAWKRRGRVPAATLFEAAWFCFTVVAALNALAIASDKGPALRTVVDAFLLPLVLFYALRNGFDAERGRVPLFWGTVVLALSLPWAGVYEFVTATDFMPYKGSSIFRTGIVRANGPFSTDNSYSIISALVGVFLVWLPREFGLRITGAARLVWRAAQGAAFFASLVPLFRAIMGAIAAALALPAVLEGRVRTLARAALVALLLAVAAIPVVIPLSRTAVFQDRITDPSSAFSRLATYLAAVDVIEDHPFVGVGIGDYSDYFGKKFGTAWYIDVEAVENVGAEAYPHNNVLGIWAETGLFAVFFYVLAAVALAGDAWRRRSVAALALMLVYWIPGMTLMSGVYSDLNLYYFCMLGVLLHAEAQSK